MTRLTEATPEGRANVWYAGHVSTGVEMERQFAAFDGTCGGGCSPKFTILDAFARLPDDLPTAVIAVPSTTTWARGRHSCPLGPKPLRDMQWPWGLPWLAPREQESVETANAELRQIMRIIVTVLDKAPEALVLLFHPEQLGPAPRGSPATVWDLPELKRWSTRAGMMRAATYQCRYGPTEYRFPIGVLSSHCLNSKLFDRGWPKIVGSPLQYRGPLPPHCNCGRRSHRPRRPSNTRIMHRGEMPLLKEDFAQYVIGILFRHSRSSRAAELLRAGDEDNLQVRGGNHIIIDSSDEQPTWVPTESEHSALEPSSIDNGLAEISWDRELAEILSLENRNASKDQNSRFANGRQDLQDNQHLQDQDFPDVHGTDEKATLP